MGGDTKILLEKDDEKKEMSAEKLVGKGGPRYWFKEKNPEPPQQQPERERDDESVTEDDPATDGPATGMSEDDPEERETGQKCGSWRKSRPSRRRTAS